MPSKLSSCVIGIDVGGTNTDAVILEKETVLAWHKTPTTPDIQSGVERAIEEVVKKARIPSTRVDSVKIGTTVRLSFAVFEVASSRDGGVFPQRICQVDAPGDKYELGGHTGHSNPFHCLSVLLVPAATYVLIMVDFSIAIRQCDTGAGLRQTGQSCRHQIMWSILEKLTTFW